MTTGILLLAAGFSRRFGSDKRLAELADGRGLLVASIESALATGLPVRVCLRPNDHTHFNHVARLGAEVIECANAESGMGATLADGVAACGDWDALLITLGDMPFLQPQTYLAVAQALEQAPLCRPTFEGKPGHPVGFRSALFAELCQLSGDEGAREVIRRHTAQLCDVQLSDPTILRDIDLPTDLD